MAKERWAHAAEVESNPKTPLEEHEITAESYKLPVVTLDIPNTENVEEEDINSIANDFIVENPELLSEIESDKLDVVAHRVEKSNGKAKWVLIIGFGFAAIGLGIAGYKLIMKHQKKIEIKLPK